MRETLSKIRHGIRGVARRFGFEVVRFNNQETLDSHLKTLLDKLRINCVLDVGGHFGEYASVLREVGYRGHIISFEPNPESFAKLSRRMAGDPLWRGHQLALGDREGELEMKLLGVSWCDSFLPLNEYGQERLQDAAVVQRIEKVQVRRLETELDRLVAHVPQPRIFLKLDTQGYDMRVIDGAGAALARIIALQSEVVVKPIYQGMMTYRDSLAKLEELGFELTGLFPVTRDGTDQLRVVEMDAVMCRFSA